MTTALKPWPKSNLWLENPDRPYSHTAPHYYGTPDKHGLQHLTFPVSVPAKECTTDKCGTVDLSVPYYHSRPYLRVVPGKRAKTVRVSADGFAHDIALRYGKFEAQGTVMTYEKFAGFLVALRNAEKPAPEPAPEVLTVTGNVYNPTPEPSVVTTWQKYPKHGQPFDYRSSCYAGTDPGDIATYPAPDAVEIIATVTEITSFDNPVVKWDAIEQKFIPTGETQRAGSITITGTPYHSDALETVPAEVLPELTPTQIAGIVARSVVNTAAQEENGPKKHIRAPQVPAPVVIEYKRAEPPAPAAIDPRAEILARFAWIEKWEADPKKRFFKSTIHNGKVDRRNALAALETAPIDVTAEYRALVTA